MRISRFLVAVVATTSALSLNVPVAAQAASVSVTDDSGDAPAFIDATSAKVWNNSTGVTARVKIPDFDRSEYWRYTVQIERKRDGVVFEARARRKAGGGFGTKFLYTRPVDDGQYHVRSCAIRHVVRDTTITIQVPRRCFRTGTGRIRVNMIPEANLLPGNEHQDDYVPDTYWTPWVAYN